MQNQPNEPVDYRDNKSLEKMTYTEYTGTIITPLLALIPSAFMFYTGAGLRGEIWPTLIATFIFYTFYFTKNIVNHTPHTLIAASPTPPPDVSPPTGSNFRVTIHSRTATYKPTSPDTGEPYIKHELLCWLIPTETVVEVIKTANLLDYAILTVPTLKETYDHMIQFDPNYPKEISFTVRSFLSYQPVIIQAEDGHQLRINDHNLRQGLTRLNAAIMDIVEPKSGPGSFEL